jgi:FMN phosphatase YigB (HAD superfamily)
MKVMKTGYELLILDYGGTYSFEYDIGSYDQIMTRTFGRAPDGSEQAAIVPLSHELAAGSIEVEEYVQKVATILGVAVPNGGVFEAATLEVTHNPSPEMKALVRDVRRAGMKLSLLSNMYLFEVEQTKSSGRFDGFDFTSFSAEAKSTKSSPKFFMQTLEHFGVSADKTLFVDDVTAYTDVAASIGIHTISADKDSFQVAGELANAIRREIGI